VEFTGGATEPRQELVEPAAGQRFRESQAEQEAARLSTHGSYIADSASQRLPADRVSGMLISKKMSAFEEPVARENDFVSTTGTE
jgi:hypothetical protein